MQKQEKLVTLVTPKFPAAVFELLNKPTRETVLSAYAKFVKDTIEEEASGVVIVDLSEMKTKEAAEVKRACHYAKVLTIAEGENDKFLHRLLEEVPPDLRNGIPSEKLLDELVERKEVELPLPNAIVVDTLKLSRHLPFAEFCKLMGELEKVNLPVYYTYDKEDTSLKDRLLDLGVWEDQLVIYDPKHEVFIATTCGDKKVVLPLAPYILLGHNLFTRERFAKLVVEG